jgi:hypothetical protein
VSSKSVTIRVLDSTHFTVNGKLERDAAATSSLRFADAAAHARRATAARAPPLIARLQIDAGTTRIARTTLSADRVPFMAAEFMAGLVAPQLAERIAAFPADWNPVARRIAVAALRDSRGSSFSAVVSGGRIDPGFRSPAHHEPSRRSCNTTTKSCA